MGTQHRFLACVLLLGGLLLQASMLAQSTPKYGVGRTPTAEEIRAWDISIGPTGEELPPGRGTAKEGAPIYRAKGCAGCHGATGLEGKAPLVRRTAVKLDEEPGRAPEAVHLVSGDVHVHERWPDPGLAAQVPEISLELGTDPGRLGEPGQHRVEPALAAPARVARDHRPQLGETHGPPPFRLLQGSLELRNPYVDPLSLLQVSLLAKKRASDTLNRALLPLAPSAVAPLLGAQYIVKAEKTTWRSASSD